MKTIQYQDNIPGYSKWLDIENHINSLTWFDINSSDLFRFSPPLDFELREKLFIRIKWAHFFRKTD